MWKCFMLLRVKELAICNIYKDVFGTSSGKRIFSNVYEMKGTQTVLIGISTCLQAFKTYNI